MKYSEYSKEKLTFLKGVDGWSEAEKKEFLDTCPESEDLPAIIENLKLVLGLIEEDRIKTDNWGHLNKSSMKAYLAKNPLNIHYGRPYGRSYYCSDTPKVFFVTVDGESVIVNSEYQIRKFIETYENGGDISSRFEVIVRTYKAKEERWAKDIEKGRYEAVNKDRIEANKKLYAMIDHFEICLTTGIREGFGNNYYSDYEYYRISNHKYSRNEYGEFVVNGEVLSEERANADVEAVSNMIAEINDIIDKYETIFKLDLGELRR